MMIQNDFNMTNIPKIQFIEEIARTSGAILMKHFSSLKKDQIHMKGKSHDYVTVVDRLSENAIIKSIKKKFPDHQIMAEESTGLDTWDPERPLWIIDPLDGTTNFIHQFPV